MSNINDPNWGRVSTYPSLFDPFYKGAEEFLAEAYSEWYAQKHPKPSPATIRWINSHVPERCPHCGCPLISRHAIPEAGMIRYACLGCKKTFTPITGTIFDHFRISPSEWMEFLLHLFEYHTLKTSARDNRNSDSTGRFWLLKVFAVLKDIQDRIVLAPSAVIDEISFRKQAADAIEAGGGKLLRGISRGRISVATGINPETNEAFAVSMGVGKPSLDSAWKAYSPHIGKGSWLVHDGEKSHRALVQRLGLWDEAYLSEETKGLPDRVNPMWAINDFHAYLRGFMESHPSFGRARLQDWLNLFVFIWNDPRDRREKVALFMEMAMHSHALIRYRGSIARKR